MKLEYHEVKVYHEAMKSGEIERSHGYSLSYEKKRSNDMKKKMETAQKLWG